VELYCRIFSFLDTSDLVSSASTVCSLWQAIASLDYVWKPLYLRHFSYMYCTRMISQKSCMSWNQLYRWSLERKNMSVLVIGAEGGGEKDERINDVKEKLVLQGFESVDIVNAKLTTPKYEQLRKYNAVLFFSYHGFNQEELGNALAEYVDNGGGVVVGAYSNCGKGNRLDGKWAEGEYNPIVLGSTSRTKQLSMGKVLKPQHIIMKGVSSFEGGEKSSHGDGNLHSESEVIVEWANGRPLVAELKKFQGPIVGLNFYPSSASVVDGGWQVASDGAKLIANAVHYCCIVRHV